MQFTFPLKLAASLDSALPLVSVVMPFRNDAATIVQAVSSVLAQSWPSIELILCDDGSTDQSLALAMDATANEHGLRLCQTGCGGRGAAAARNAGLDLASGTFVAFLDADDLWFSTKLERCVRRMVEENLDMLGHAEVWRSPAGTNQEVRYSSLVDSSIPFALSVYRQNPFSTSATVVRTSLIERVGRFDEQLPSAEDYDFWLRLCLVPGVRAALLDEVLGVYSLRAGSESSRVDARHVAMMHIGDRFLAQARVLSPSPRLERWRYRSRVRLASGVRYFKAGQRVKGALLASVGLLQWPFRPEIARWFSARRGMRAAGTNESSTESAQ